MAEVVIPIGYGTAIFDFTVSGSDMTTTCGFKQRSGIYTPNEAAEEISDAMEVSGGPADPANMLTSARYRGCRVYMQTPDGLVGGEFSVSTPGTVSGTGIQQGWAIVVKKLTGYLGKTKKGRLYFPPVGLTAGNTELNGELDPIMPPALDDQFGLWLDAFQTTGHLPYLLHSDVEEAPNAITALAVSTKMGFQRRRLTS